VAVLRTQFVGNLVSSISVTHYLNNIVMWLVHHNWFCGL